MGDWITFIKERFPLGTHLPMIVSFTLANVCVGLQSDQSIRDYLFPICISLVLTFSFFFRLRLFDEIKDVEVDKRINPTRPLARGLLSVKEVKRMLALLVLFELGFTLYLGISVFYIQLVAIAYSLLMYNEFLIGMWLRPHLTLYAVLHTAVAFLIGICIQSQVLQLKYTDIGSELILFGLVNWSMFNIFEFARKTFTPDEEVSHHDSYSKLYGLNGALLLTISQAFIALTLLFVITYNFYLIGIQVSILFILIFSSFLLLHKNRGELFRSIWGLYLVCFYVVLIFFHN